MNQASTQLQFVYRDGPPEHPNGMLLVTILGESDVPQKFVCRVDAVIKSTGPVPAVGVTINAHVSALRLAWRGQ